MSKNMLALLALESSIALKSDASVAQIRELRPNTTAKIEITGTDNNLILELGPSIISIMSIDQPVPPGTFDRAIERGMLWPSAKQVLARHTSHIAVGTLNAGATTAERVVAAEHLMWACAAIAGVTPCLGVHWVSAETVSARDNFIATFKVMHRDALPLTIWMRLNLFAGIELNGRPTTGCVTTGLAEFVGREIEFAASPLPAEAVASLVLAIAQFALTEGKAIAHGETFPVGPAQQMKVSLIEKGRVLAAPVYHVSQAA